VGAAEAAIFALALNGAPAFAGSAPVIPPGPDYSMMGPEAVVKSTADRMFTALDQNRAALKADPDKVTPLVEQILLPNFDVDYATRLVLAQNWRLATPDQQVRFQKAFIAFLTRTYGKAIVGFERDRLKFLPMRGPVDPKRTFVQTEIARSGGAPTPVDYVLRQTPQGWKVFDLVIEGISYVRNYRQSFADEIEQQGRGDAAKGIEAVIARLEAGTFQPPADPISKPGAK
jgi:phospholipid transport system substrate-binding protein